MARPQLEALPRVQMSVSVSAKTAEFILKTKKRLHAQNPNAKTGQAIDSIVDFAEVRKFDPIKIKKPADASTRPPAKPATPSAAKV
jgi:hypothetical protein